MPRAVTVVIFPGFQLLDAAGPSSAFEIAERFRPGSYDLALTAPHGGPVASSSGLTLSARPLDDAPVDTVGPAVENHARFAKRTNVGFMEVVNRSRIRLRVFERGVGETLACGTGACAAVAVGQRLGLLDTEVTVDAPGGQMIVRWQGPGEHLWMTGPAVKVYEGTVDVQ